MGVATIWCSTKKPAISASWRILTMIKASKWKRRLTHRWLCSSTRWSRALNSPSFFKIIIMMGPNPTNRRSQTLWWKLTKALRLKEFHIHLRSRSIKCLKRRRSLKKRRRRWLLFGSARYARRWICWKMAISARIYLVNSTYRCLKICRLKKSVWTNT